MLSVSRAGAEVLGDVEAVPNPSEPPFRATNSDCGSREVGDIDKAQLQ